MAKEKVKKGKKLILWVLILLIVATSGGVVATIVTPKILDALSSKKTTVKHHSKTIVSGKQEIVPVKKFVINLTSEDGSNSTQYAQITLSFLVANSEQKAKIKKMSQLLEIALLTLLGKKMQVTYWALRIV